MEEYDESKLIEAVRNVINISGVVTIMDDDKERLMRYGNILSRHDYRVNLRHNEPGTTSIKYHLTIRKAKKAKGVLNGI